MLSQPGLGSIIQHPVRQTPILLAENSPLSVGLAARRGAAASGRGLNSSKLGQSLVPRVKGHRLGSCDCGEAKP
eukprot:2081103-Rhodomonas_salina.2